MQRRERWPSRGGWRIDGAGLVVVVAVELVVVLGLLA
jgi:hypothetical protein